MLAIKNTKKYRALIFFILLNTYENSLEFHCNSCLDCEQNSRITDMTVITQPYKTQLHSHSDCGQFI